MRSMRVGLLLGVTLGATLMCSGPARAWQESPHSALLWSYPDGFTSDVPANAVFRAFGYLGPDARNDRPIVMELDGREVPSSAAALEIEGSWPDDEIEFQRRFQHPVASAEFVPPELLSPGKHEVEFKVMGWDYESGSYETVASYRFTVQADGIPPNPVNTDVAISAVTAYTQSVGPGPSGPVPPVEALDGTCQAAAVLRHRDANGGYLWGPPRLDLIDSGPATRVEVPPRSAFAARVEIAGNDHALGYFIDSQFVPAGCSAVIDDGIALDWNEGGAQPFAVSFYAQAVLRAGLGEVHGFTGEVPMIESEFPRPFVPYPEAQSTSGGACSVAAAGARTNGSALATLTLFVSSVVLFQHRRRARRLSAGAVRQ